MSRFRANTSASAVDREVQGYVAAAEKAIQAALAACARARRADDGATRLAPVRRDLERTLGTLQSVRRVNPPDAPDFRPAERVLQAAINTCAEHVEGADRYARVRRDLERARDALRGVRPARAPDLDLDLAPEPPPFVVDEPAALPEGELVPVEVDPIADGEP